MPTRPLLPLPTPNHEPPPPGHSGYTPLRLPSRDRQREYFGPTFERLRRAITDNTGEAAQIFDDANNLAPERVLVFETAGPVQNFLKAIAKVPGFQFMGDFESEFEADENFAVIDQRKGRGGADRTDEPIASRYYLTMPNLAALSQLLSLWDRWRRQEQMAEGFAPFADLFNRLHDLRPWGPTDRVSPEAISIWREEIVSNPRRPVRIEIELWFKEARGDREAASSDVTALITQAEGRILQEIIVEEIAYHGMLVELPVGEIENLIAHRNVALAIDDDVMFLRPQSVLQGPFEMEASTFEEEGERIVDTRIGNPVAALFDGVPMQAHRLLANRLVIDDPYDLEGRAVVAHRRHGTAMASLVLHGDLNAGDESLSRRLYVLPLLSSSNGESEHSDPDRLLIDLIHSAVVRMKGQNGTEGSAPNVFLVNLSLGDPKRPFSRLMSPLARLLDYLSYRYNLLFFVSGGNVTAPLAIADFDTWTDLETASPEEREKSFIRALNTAKRERTILSPAEALNAITVGAQHHDDVPNRPRTINTVDPFRSNTLPNVSSGLGLGHRRMIKPEIYLPGGREYVRMRSSGGGVTISIGPPGRLYGLSAAVPDDAGQGRLNQVALSDGTSSATALATRAGHQIFDGLMDAEGGSLLSDIPPRYYAVVTKALLIHSAEWHESASLIKEICGPAGQYQHAERTENSCRFVGFGIPDIIKVLDCEPNQATLAGYGEIRTEQSVVYRIPLPESLERVTAPRSLSITVAWLSPVKPKHQAYRCVRLEAEPVTKSIESFGVRRKKTQPTDGSVRKGSVFHEHYEGAAAIPFIDDGHLLLRVWCKDDAGISAEVAIQYGIAITIQAEGALPIYQEVQQRLRVQPIP
ncbi:S8 family peptidase [Terriglobus albidus]|uniref:S8 family peptidase n=1 Tax=Terriglobus albidus TaxID=1592106 RepID=A0A5B9E822_9BACT|nr:S8 family peptidase [Terriglobus albidus]QEE27315.1 S8 family peptidase [Terriglobus albidus]